jgi:hypothetical protein
MISPADTHLTVLGAHDIGRAEPGQRRERAGPTKNQAIGQGYWPGYWPGRDGAGTEHSADHAGRCTTCGW